MSDLRHAFYVQPMNQVYIETIAMYVIWTALMLLLRGKSRRIVSCIGVVCAVALIVLYTIYRRGGSEEAVSLIPFISFINAKTQPEFYRTMFMNMLLFLPLGLSLPFALSEKMKHKVLISILCGLILSVLVEVLQYVFRLGRCETDDVLMNTLGVLIGVTSYLLCGLIAVCRNKYRKKH